MITIENPPPHSNVAPDVMDSRGAADLLRVHLTTVQELAKRREIPCCKVGKDYRFLRAALLEWLRGGAVLRQSKR